MVWPQVITLGGFHCNTNFNKIFQTGRSQQSWHLIFPNWVKPNTTVDVTFIARKYRGRRIYKFPVYFSKLQWLSCLPWKNSHFRKDVSNRSYLVSKTKNTSDPQNIICNELNYSIIVKLNITFFWKLILWHY